MSNELSLVYCDERGQIYDFPGRLAAFRSGRTIVPASMSESIKIPFGSEIFSLPGRSPYSYSARSNSCHIVGAIKGRSIDAASAFLPSSYLRTYLPAYSERKGAKRLSLWAYAGIGIDGDDFYAPAFRIDDDVRSDPAIHDNDAELEKKTRALSSQFPKNRLVKQLSKCAREYRCLCARNFFLRRYEAPIPTTPVCNAGCLGCLSYQEKDLSGFGESQMRLDFAPDPAEIAEVILYHFGNVPGGVASFGQGCEGEPLMRGKALAESIRMVREKTADGTIHLNTNGSLPEMAELLIDAGLNSMRVSLNSPTEKYYNPYYKPQGYVMADIFRTIRRGLDRGIFVSLNLFFFPGFTDMQSEVDALYGLLKEYPVNMIQTRNLNIDPDYYLDSIGYEESQHIGIRKLVEMLRSDFPAIKLGYYNPPVVSV
jgi:pyruvate-formate lyase-activating enzyme